MWWEPSAALAAVWLFWGFVVVSLYLISLAIFFATKRLIAAVKGDHKTATAAAIDKLEKRIKSLERQLEDQRVIYDAQLRTLKGDYQRLSSDKD